MREKILILVLLCRFSLCDKSYYVVLPQVWTMPYTTNLWKRLQVSEYACNKYVTFINPDVQDDMLPDDSSCVLSGVSFLIRSCNAFFHPFTVCEFLVIAKTAWVNQRWFTVSHPGEYHLTCKQTLFPISSSKGMLKRNVSKPKARV